MPGDERASRLTLPQDDRSLLASGEMRILGLLPRSSNYTFLVRLAGDGEPEAELVAEIRGTSDLDRLVAWCRDDRPAIVHEAVMALVLLGAAGQARLAALLDEALIGRFADADWSLLLGPDPDGRATPPAEAEAGGRDG
jgi:hypothetical protein